MDNRFDRLQVLGLINGFSMVQLTWITLRRREERNPWYDNAIDVSRVTAGMVDASTHRGNLHSSTGQKVSFYFTNIPECLPIFLLCQQFEVLDHRPVLTHGSYRR